MIIEGIELYWLSVPLNTPFKTALRTVENVNDLVICIRTNDHVFGIGSTPSTPQITGYDHANSIDNIKRIAPVLLGKSVKEAHLWLEDITLPCNVNCALSTAIYDLLSKQASLPLYRYLNQQASHQLLSTGITISDNNLTQMHQDIDLAYKNGFRCFKIKVGKTATQDLYKIHTLYQQCQSLKESVSIFLDANQGWTESQCISIMQDLEAQFCCFNLLEQPVKASDISAMTRIKQNIITPLMADEAVFSVSHAQTIIEQNASDVINVKLVKSGGFKSAIQTIELCHSRNVQCMIGCMLESSIGVAAASHLVVAFSEKIKWVDLDSPTLAQYDPISASNFYGPTIDVNTTPGLGINDLSFLPPPFWQMTNVSTSI